MGCNYKRYSRYVITLRGRSKRLEKFKEACTALSVDYLEPQYNEETRWNSNEVMISPFIYLIDVIQYLNDNYFYTKVADKNKWDQK